MQDEAMALKIFPMILNYSDSIRQVLKADRGYSVFQTNLIN